MLQAYPTKHGTGISIYGDYGDLKSLYNTVHQIASLLTKVNKSQEGQKGLLMNLAYEIRKAFDGHRLKEEIEYIGDETKYMYYGFRVVWTDILIFMSALRHNAGFVRTERRDQANLYILEDIIEKALYSYDPTGVSKIKEFISQRININDPHVFSIYQAIHIEFVSGRSGKIRFRGIPDLLIQFFSEWLPRYKNLIASFEASAAVQKCDVADLEFSDFPEIKW